MSGPNIPVDPFFQKMENLQITPIHPIVFASNNKQKALFEWMNQKIEKYNALLQNPKKNNTDAAQLLLQEIEYCGDFLANHSDPSLSGPGRNWFLTSGIALQPGRFVQCLFEMRSESGELDFETLFAKAEAAGVDKKMIEAIKAKLNSGPYQNYGEGLTNHAILRQLRKVILYAAMTTDSKKPGPLQAILREVDNQLYAVIQAEPTLRQYYELQQQYTRYFEAFYDPEKKEAALNFMRVLAMVETHLLNASDDTIIQFYKNNPSYGIIAQKDEDFGKEEGEVSSVKGRRIPISQLKAEWVKNGACTTAQLKALAPALFQKYDLQFLAAGNNITWRLKDKESGEYLILRAAKQKLTNLDHIAILQDTPAGDYFSPEYVTLVGAIDEGDRMDDYTLSLIQYCAKGNLQHVRKSIAAENSGLIQKEAGQLLSPFFNFCARLIDENAYLTDIKLSNFLVDQISDLKSVRVCAEGTDVHSLSRNDITGDITPLYAPPEWDGFYTVIDCEFIPARDAHKMGEIYYDKTTHQYSVLGYNGEFYQGQAEELGDSKNRAGIVRKIEKDIRFDMDKFMSYQMGLALYDFLTGLTITLEGEDNIERNEARAKALEQLKTFKSSGSFDYSAAVFQGVEGQILRELCTSLLKTNPKERMSIHTAAIKLNALEQRSAKAALLEELIEIYKKHNEQFNSDPDFLRKYQAMRDFMKEVSEAKRVTNDANFLQHALESEASRLENWLRHAMEQPQRVEHFYPHYARSLFNEGFNGHLLDCDQILHALAKTAINSAAVEEKEALLQQVETLLHSLAEAMTHFLSEHRNNVNSIPALEFAKMLEAASALENYMNMLSMHFKNLQKSDLQGIKESLSTFTQLPADELAQKLRKEAAYLHYHVLYEEKDKQQGIPSYLRTLRQSLVYHFLESHPDAKEKEVEHYLNDLFKSDKDLIAQAARYEQKLANQEYGKAYAESLALNEQITTLYTKILGEDNEDPIVAQMAQLRSEMNAAKQSHIVSAQGLAETLQKVNVELVNSMSYVAGPRLSSSYKPVYADKEWEKLKEDSVNVLSPTKKWAHRVLMGVGVSLGLVLVVGTGGVAAAPIVAAEIASAVSPTVANSVIGSITASSILARAKVVFSRNKEIKDSERLFNTTTGVVDSLADSAANKPKVETPVGKDLIHPNKPGVTSPLSSNPSDLFYHGAKAEVKEKPEDSEGEGSKDSGSHIDPIR